MLLEWLWYFCWHFFSCWKMLFHQNQNVSWKHYLFWRQLCWEDFFSGPEGVNILSLILISWKLWESLIFVSYWNKNKFQSFEMFSKMELLFSSQPYSVCFSFYVLAVLIFRAFGFQAYLHFYGSLITNTSSYLIILLAFFFKLHFFQTN